MTLLLLKVTLAPALVGGASLVSRRWGPRAGGLAAALPIVAGPALLVFALEQGLPFTAAAAHGTLLGLVPLSVFSVVHAALARALLGRVRRRLAAPICLATGWAAFLAVAALLRPAQLPGWGAPLIGAGALLAGRALVPRARADGEPPLRHHPALELGLRMLLAAGLVTGLTALAGALGPAWSGLLTPFPVASSVLVLGTHLADGPDRLSVLLRGFLVGLHGFVAFLTVLAFGLVPLGPGAAFGLGLAASLAISALVTWRPWRRARRGWFRGETAALLLAACAASTACSRSHDVFEAARDGDLRFLERALDGGADVAARGPDDETVLHLAARHGRAEVVAWLCRHGASVSARNRHGETALALAAAEGHLSAVSALARAGADVQSADRDGVTPLIQAAARGHAAVVRRLIELGARVDAVSKEGLTALGYACAGGRASIAAALIGAGAEVDVRLHDGDTILMHAANRGDVEIVRLLLEHGADVNARNRSSDTALMAASRSRQLAVVKVLLDEGADPRIRDETGATALTHAERGGSAAIIGLLRHPASP